MTTEEKAKKYDEALERAKKYNIDDAYASQGTVIKSIFPELAESEDERVRKELIGALMWQRDCLDAKGPHDNNLILPGFTMKVGDILAWLEKQKEQPADAKLERVIKASRSVLNNWLDGTDCPDVSGAFAELEYAIREYDGEERQKEQKPNFDTHWENGSMVCEQKEPHYTKRNALFDKCVENCDPKTVEEVNKRVDDIMNMSELSAFEQALTNFIGYWEDDEEHWPSQFVKKHGKHILDMAREELEKEQKPADLSEMMVHKEPYIAPVPTPMVADEQKPVEPSGKLSRQDYLYQLLIDQLITYSDYEYLIGQKPVDYDHEMWKNCEVNFEGGKKEVIEHPEKYGLQKPTEWSEEDKKTIDDACCWIAEYAGYFIDKNWGKASMLIGLREKLLSLRPSWKPSEEQMNALQVAAMVSKTDFNTLTSLLADLKKL